MPYVNKIRIFLYFPLMSKEIETIFDKRISLNANMYSIKEYLPLLSKESTFLFYHKDFATLLEGDIPLNDLYKGEWLSIEVYEQLGQSC